MSARSRFVRTAALGAVTVAVLAACSDDAGRTAPSAPDGRTATAPVKQVAAAECARTPERGKIVRTGYGLSYESGTMTVEVKAADGSARCLQFSKSGPADPQVPPDTLLFTFAADGGQGAQLEFLSVDLSGGVLPPIGDGVLHRVRPLDSPINALVGVAVDGKYFRATNCALTLSTVNEEGASGRFSCPQAFSQTANPFAPDDDVDHDAPDAEPTAQTVTLSGWFDVEP